jgi:SAM-dependent methyltransferase
LVASRPGGQDEKVLNPPSQYRDDSNLRARQRLWEYQLPAFDLMAWVIDLAAPVPGQRVLDLGCGNGVYLRTLRQRRIAATVGCDLSFGMLQAAGPTAAVCASASQLPFATAAFDAVLAAHMLYHVEDRPTAIGEIRRVLADGGAFVAVTNGAAHLRSLRACVEAAVAPSTPGWKMLDRSDRAFSLKSGQALLRQAFDVVQRVRPETPHRVFVRDPEIAAGYVASVADYYQPEVAVAWTDVVESVRRHVAGIIDRDGAFVTSGDTGAFVCH